jgi:hypothetical protein
MLEPTMVKLEGDFSSIKEFNYTAVEKLSDFFDISFVEKNPVEYKLWFTNLKEIAEQNLGLAHCILHNQSSRNAINIAYQRTGSEVFNRPYRSSIGAYSFYKGWSKYQPDTISINGTRLSGTKYWASQLSTADFIVLNVRDIQQADEIVVPVFVDLAQVEHKIKKSNATPMGMNVAYPCDFHIDSEIPIEWICTKDMLHKQISSFHFYGLTANYISCATSLLNQAEAQGYNIDYSIKKLKLDIEVSTMLWEKSFNEVFDDISPTQFKNLNTQYQFARKNLINVTTLFLEVMNTGMCDQESDGSQKFRDALSMSSHVVNLYKHLDNVIKRLS